MLLLHTIPSALAVVAACLVGVVSPTIVNSNVRRTVDISNYVVHEKIEIIFTSSERASAYELVFGKSSGLAHLSVVERDSKTPLRVTLDREKGSASVALPGGVQPGAKFQLTVSAVLSHRLSPFPTEMTLTGRHLVRYNGLLWFRSPYATTQTRTVLTLGGALTSATDHPTRKAESRQLTYGPVNDLPANDDTLVSAHFELTRPFMIAKEYEKKLELSHWAAKLAVQETYDLWNGAAKLKNHFSRIDYMLTGSKGEGSVAVHSLKFTLPPSVRDPYYKDEVGNVSTSRFHQNLYKSTFEIRPRFPIYGGWKYKWFHGYDLPLADFVKRDASGRYIFKINFWEPINDMTIEKATIKIALPEGAINFKVHLPFEVDSIEKVKYYNYFDSIGRTMVVIQKTNVVAEHSQDIQVSYEYSSQEYLRKPIILSLAVLLCFISAIFLNRADMTISRDPKEDARLLIKSYRYAAQDVSNDLASLLTKLVAVHNAFKAQAVSTRDVEKFKKECASIESAIQNAEQEFSNLVSKLNKIGGAHGLNVQVSTSAISDLKTLYGEKVAKVKTMHADVIAFQAGAKGAHTGEDAGSKKEAVMANVEKVEAEVVRIDAKIDAALQNLI